MSYLENLKTEASYTHTLNGAKTHGSSGDEAIKNAVRQAREMLAGNVVEKIREGLEGLVDPAQAE